MQSAEVASWAASSREYLRKFSWLQVPANQYSKYTDLTSNSSGEAHAA